jgi:hypothetical protein
MFDRDPRPGIGHRDDRVVCQFLRQQPDPDHECNSGNREYLDNYDIVCSSSVVFNNNYFISDSELEFICPHADTDIKAVDKSRGGHCGRGRGRLGWFGRGLGWGDLFATQEEAEAEASRCTGDQPNDVNVRCYKADGIFCALAFVCASPLRKPAEGRR